jgi:hypothetical protein
MGPSSCRSMEIRNESIGSFSDRDFPSITKIGESSCRCKSLRQLKRDEQGFAGPPWLDARLFDNLFVKRISSHVECTDWPKVRIASGDTGRLLRFERCSSEPPSLVR